MLTNEPTEYDLDRVVISTLEAKVLADVIRSAFGELRAERTRTETLRAALEMGLYAGAHSPACAVRHTPHPCDCGRDPFVEAARAALAASVEETP